MACKRRRGLLYAGSNTVDDVAWYTSNTNDTGTREVKTKQANGYGLYDMSGNVWEWCYDWYGYVENSTADTGATSGSERVRRGGSWFDIDNVCQVSYRSSDFPFSRCQLLRFPCCAFSQLALAGSVRKLLKSSAYAEVRVQF